MVILIKREEGSFASYGSVGLLVGDLHKRANPKKWVVMDSY